MKQCEIWYANLNPTKGSEQAGLRPVVILSGNLLNQYLPIVIVAPLIRSTRIIRALGKGRAQKNPCSLTAEVFN